MPARRSPWPRDRWRASWMVMNHRPRDRSALLEYRVTVDPSRTITPVEPLWLSVLPWTRHDATRARPGRLRQPVVESRRELVTALRHAGAYRVYCSLHPVYMSQYVRVR